MTVVLTITLLSFFSSAVEVPSYFIGWYCMDKWGRRWILFVTMMIGGLSCISCIFVPVGRLNSVTQPMHAVTVWIMG